MGSHFVLLLNQTLKKQMQKNFKYIENKLLKHYKSKIIPVFYIQDYKISHIRAYNTISDIAINRRGCTFNGFYPLSRWGY